MNDNTAKVVQKVKVSPYPFEVILVGTAGQVKAMILKLNQRGFIAEIPNVPFVVSSKHEANFTLPVLHHVFKEEVVVVKTYDEFRGKGAAGNQIRRMTEFHFKKLSPAGKNHIDEFVSKIGQK